MRDAKRLLINTAQPIAEISDAVGIDNPAYFSRLFTQRVGLGPRAFRLNPREMKVDRLGKSRSKRRQPMR